MIALDYLHRKVCHLPKLLQDLLTCRMLIMTDLHMHSTHFRNLFLQWKLDPSIVMTLQEIASRDMKLQNVLMCGEESQRPLLKVTGFGHAKVIRIDSPDDKFAWLLLRAIDAEALGNLRDLSSALSKH